MACYYVRLYTHDSHRLCPLIHPPNSGRLASFSYNDIVLQQKLHHNIIWRQHLRDLMMMFATK